MSLIALLIACVVAYCEVSIARLRCSEAVVIGTHQLGHSGGPACYGDPLLFPVDVHIKAGVLSIL